MLDIDDCVVVAVARLAHTFVESEILVKQTRVEMKSFTSKSTNNELKLLKSGFSVSGANPLALADSRDICG